MADVSDGSAKGAGAAGDGAGGSSGATAVLEYDSQGGEKVWRAGTLTYTKRGLVRVFSWLLWGDLAWSLRDRTLGGLIMSFMVYVQASNKLISILTSVLPSIINIPLQPIVSYMSDRHRGPRGRRRPFLIIGVPLAATCIVGMGLAPMIGGWLHHIFGIQAWGENYTIIGCFAVFFLTYDVAAVVSGAVFGAFCNDVVPQELLGRFWGMVRAVSIAVQIVCMFWLMGYANDHLALIFGCVGVIYGVGFTWSVLVVKEGTYPPPESTGEKGGPFQSLYNAIMSYTKVCFSKPFYLWAFAAMIVPGMAFSNIYAWAQLFATKNIGIVPGDFFKLTGVYFVLSLPLAPLQGWLADKIHPLRVAMIVMGLHVPACLWGWLYIVDQRTFAIAFVVTGLLQVLYNTAVSALWPRIFPRETFAQLSSAAGLVGTVVSMGYGFSVAWFLDYTNSAYEYTFLLAGLMSIVALVAIMIMYKKFNELGGAKNYVAP